MLVVIVTDNGFAAEAIRRSFRQSQRPTKKSRQSGIQMNGEFSEWANSPE